jgi:hypothetical protein
LQNLTVKVSGRVGADANAMSQLQKYLTRAGDLNLTSYLATTFKIDIAYLACRRGGANANAVSQLQSDNNEAKHLRTSYLTTRYQFGIIIYYGVQKRWG